MTGDIKPGSIPAGWLEAAWLAAKVYNSALATGEVPGTMAGELEAVQRVISGLDERKADVPRRSNVAGFVNFHGADNVAAFLVRQPDGNLRLTPVANSQYVESKYRRGATVASHMAKRVIEMHNLALSCDAPGIRDQRTIPDIVRWLEAGKSLKDGRREIRIEIKPIPAELHDDVVSCMLLDEAGPLLIFVGDQNVHLPEGLMRVDAVSTPRKELARMLSCKLPSDWFEIPRDLLREWKDEVQDRAEGIVEMANAAVLAGNHDIPAAQDVSSILNLLIKTAFGTGEGANVGYAVSRPSKSLKAALLGCLEIHDGSLAFRPDLLPNALPEHPGKRSRSV